MILGETMDVPPVSVTLYYVAADGTSFSTVTRSIAVSEGESICEEAVNALLRSGSSPDRMTSFRRGRSFSASNTPAALRRSTCRSTRSTCRASRST